MTIQYLEEYKTFLENYQRGQMDAEEVGLFIMKMVRYYSDFNIEFSKADIVYNIKLSQIENKRDEETGKMPTSTKAKNDADSTPESEARIMARCHLQNVENIINGLKAMIKGLQNEYSHNTLT